MEPQGLTGGMFQAQRPVFSDPIVQYYPDGVPSGEPEIPILQPEVVETERQQLCGRFNAEIEIAESGRDTKEDIWIKIERYLSGRDVNEVPEGYNESTFFYRRMPRLTQIGKEKIYKHICPIQGTPWDVQASPRVQNMPPEEAQARVRALREEIKDIHEGMDMERFLDDMAEYMSNLGTAVVYGPVPMAQPRLRWSNGSEYIANNDAEKPMWQIFDPKRVYPDPNAKREQDLEYVYFHYVLSSHQLRNLAEDDSFIKEEIADLLIDYPNGNWSGNVKPWEQVPSPGANSKSTLDRYVVWMRIGFLTPDALQTLSEDVERSGDLKDWDNLSDDQKNALTESLWEIWMCENRIIKIAQRRFQPNRMPVYFIPFRRDPCSIFGVGIGESALEVVEMLVNTARAIDDTLADTSGYNVIIDAGSIANTDLRPAPRKTWIYNNKGSVRKEGPAGRPVEMWKVPSNLEEQMKCFQLWESMLPVVTGITEMTTGADLGSGIRTEQMLNDMWTSIEEFLRSTIGNVDQYWWKPHLRDCYQWIQQYYPDNAEMKIDANMIVSGVRGALRRELVGRRVEAFYGKMSNIGMSDWFDEVELAQTIAEGMGIEAERAILTPQKYVERQALRAQQKQLESMSTNAAMLEDKSRERAHTSARDAALQSLQATLTADPKSPMLPSLYEQSIKLTGQLTPRSTAGLSVLSKMLATYYEGLGMATPEEAEVIAAPVVANNPLELAPGYRDPEQAAMAAQLGEGPQTPTNPVPAIQTTQQAIVGDEQ